MVQGQEIISIHNPAGCDHQDHFIDTYVGWPGSVLDTRVLRHSPLYRRSVYPPPGHFILADGGYPCLRQPLPLIPHTRGQYKVWESSDLTSIITFLDDEDQVITAYVILHNICLGVTGIMAPEDEHEEDVAEDEGENALEGVSGAPWHDQLSAEVSDLEVVPADHDYL
ncbi:hypothetical protein QQF64_023608 [Cirrhinus molitorella]|uniref:DDE Tnp4 domain-containing protein n=1 Tax=Cirrhinus molitorella TaxID=172907 RepID=A0ABR3NJ15_9TELE